MNHKLAVSMAVVSIGCVLGCAGMLSTPTIPATFANVESRMTVQHDDVDGITWYQSAGFEWQRLYCSMQVRVGRRDAGGQPFVRLYISYTGAHPILASEVTVKVNDLRYDFATLPWFTPHIFDDGSCIETFECTANEYQLNMLHHIALAETATVRLRGQTAYDDFILDRASCIRIADALTMYEKLGGKVSDASESESSK